MSEETNAVLALKHAWTGAVETSDKVRELASSVLALGDETPPGNLDLEAYHRLTVAHANAAQALRGLVERLQERAGRAN